MTLTKHPPPLSFEVFCTFTLKFCKNGTFTLKVKIWPPHFWFASYGPANSSVTNMFQDLNWNTLEERRKRAKQSKVIMFYRIVQQTVAIPSQSYLIPRCASSSAKSCICFQYAKHDQTLRVFGRVLHVESKQRTSASFCYLSNIDIFQYVRGAFGK